MRLLKAAALLAAGYLFAIAGRPTAADAPPPLNREDPAGRSLDANLWMQTSAEYRACCLQAYNLAALRLEAKLAGNPKFDKPPAVILDLDETVLDNSGYQAMLARSGLGFDQRLFELWEAKHAADVELVPGAKEFLALLKEKKVEYCFISNRDEPNRAGCKAALERLGIAVPDAQLLLATTTSDKTARRAAIAEKFTVLMWVGDNLRDFDEAFRYGKEIKEPTFESFKKALDARAGVVDANKAKFGTEWIIFPNPVYGEWAKPFGRGQTDLEFLRPTKWEKR